MRIIIYSHGHPELSRGGAENAAYAQFQALKQKGHDCLFIARAAPKQIGHDGRIGAFRGRDDELLWTGSDFDGFRLVANDFEKAMTDLQNIVDVFKPDAFHFHHYFGVGLDVVGLLAKNNNLKVFLTLHEYGMICNHFGQMIKTNNELCRVSSASECSSCFPDYSSGFFFLRRNLILEYTKHIAGFFSPSEFLAQRYVDFGIPAEKMHVIENFMKLDYVKEDLAAPTDEEGDDHKIRIGYFGQFTPFKGVAVFVNAVKYLKRSTLRRVRFSLHGTANGQMNMDYFATVEPLIEKYSDTIELNGAYKSSEVLSLMGACDWVVMPSTWWENAPVVIQEARLAGVPMLGSNIGGMKEKIIPGVTGDHFLVGSSKSLADKIEAIAAGQLTIPPIVFDVNTHNDECYGKFMAQLEA